MLKIGHRGAAGYVTENTAAAIKKALDLGVDMIELDVRRCLSGELVVFHDSSVNRVTNGTGAIRKMTLEQIKTLHTKDGEEILTLIEALQLIDGRCWVILDIKCGDVAEELIRVLHNCIDSKQWRKRQFLVSSFRYGELARIKKLDKEIKIGLLYYRYVRSVLSRAKKMSAYSVHFHTNHLSKDDIEALHNHDIKTFVWTVNTHTDAKRVRRLGADGVISDFPDAV